MAMENETDKCATGATSKIIFTTTNGEKLEKGCFNFGHTIPELTKEDGLKQPQGSHLNTQIIIGRTSPTEYPTVKEFMKKMGAMAIMSDTTLFLLFTIWVILVETAIIPSHKRGFICGDLSISFKFEGDTITTAMILSSVVIPFPLMWLIELLKLRSQSSRLALWKRALYITLNWYNKFLIGFLIHLCLVEAMKTIMGECRPHFLDTCRPDTAINCTIGTFVSDFTCTNTEVPASLVSDSYRSFPSGHSSVGHYEGLFMAWFLYKRFPNTRCKWIVPFLQTGCLIWGAACGITRITDNRHHWWDVLIGAIIGLLAAVYAAKSLCHNFRVFRTSWSEEQLESSSTEAHKNDNQLLCVSTSGKDDVNSHTA
uniref:Putative lipid phosphate phosphatase n=1 Tax=Lutzomyia longipalpis TaxID=7200 RepID=A0A1B0CLC2_LUTLO